MPTIFCSTKLSKLIGLKTKLSTPIKDDWNGHLFAVQGRKCIAFVHKETFYSFAMFDVLKSDLKEFKKIFIENFFKQLNDDGLLTTELKEKLILHYQNFEIATTDNDRSTIGYLNDFIARIKYYRDGLPQTLEVAKEYVSCYSNENLIGVRSYINAKELMLEYLNK